MLKYLIPILVLSLVLVSCQQKPSEPKPTMPSTDSLSLQKNELTKNNIILFFGNSITYGYQLDREESFPSLIQEKIDASGLDYTTINAGLSGETSAGGLNRIDWVIKQNPPDIFVLELGANDGLQGKSIAAMQKNLQGIIDKVRAKNPDVKIIIAGMEAPPNNGKKYTDDFRQVFVTLSKDNKATLIPFLLEGVAGKPELNLGDRIHPNPQGQKIVANTVWKYLQPSL